MLDTITKRRSIRKYLEVPVEQEKIDEILKAGMYAPSARNIKAWQFVVINDREMISKIGETKPHSLFSKEAPLAIVLCSEDWQYWLQDLCFAAESMSLEAVNQGLGSCMVEFFNSKATSGEDGEAHVKTILGIPAEMRVLGMLAIGYPGEEKAPHTDSEFIKEKIHQNRW